MENGSMYGMVVLRCLGALICESLPISSDSVLRCSGTFVLIHAAERNLALAQVGIRVVINVD